MNMRTMQRRTPAGEREGLAPRMREPRPAPGRTHASGGAGRAWRDYLSRGPWFTVGVLTAANAFAFLDRQVLGLLIEPIRADLGLTDTQISLLIGFAFAIFYSVFGIPIGRLVDARSRRLIIAAGITVWSLATAACGLARSFWTLFLGRIGVGAGEATLGPAAMSMISDLFPPERRGTAIAVFITGSAIGAGFATVFAATVFAVLEDFDQIDLPLVGAMRPWQIVFFVVGLPGLLVGGLALAMREPARGDDVGPGGIPLREVWAHVREHAVLITSVLVGFSILAIKSYGIATWVPTFFVRTHGWSVGEAGIYFGLTLAITATIGALLGGRLSDWLASRGRGDAKILIAISANLLTLLPIVAFPLVPDDMAALALVAAYYLFAAATTPMGAAIVQEITPPRMRGQIYAVFLFTATLVGMGFGPLSIALITDNVFGDPADLRYSLAIVPVFTVSLALVFLLMARRRLRELPQVY